MTISSNTNIGEDCQIFHSASIGAIPQDLKFNNEDTIVVIGDRTKIREFVTINKGTSSLGKTVVGSDCLLMASVHIAHDCIEPNKIENTLGKMFVIYRKEEGDNFNVVPEISEFPYDRRYCEAFSDAEKYQIYKFEKVDTEELDD